jgi:glycerate kinase
MKVLLATNYFKGSLSAIKAAEIIKRGFLRVDRNVQTQIIPISDGGDGTIEAIKYYTECEEMQSRVQGPLDGKVSAQWLIINKENKKVAIIEGAQANGLSLLTPMQYNPLKTTTYGIGELIREALDKDCQEIIVTIGGSSTNDGGAGLFQALGGKLLDKDDNELKQGGGALKALRKIEISNLDGRINQVKIIVACDVNNPLCGENGSSAIYGPQKGANLEEVRLLDKNLFLFADKVAEVTGQDYRNYPGVGAAGGIGFALKALLNAEMIAGFDLIADLSNMENKIKTMDLVITSEGRLDLQSLSGKAPCQVASLAQKYNIPTVVIAGSIEKGLDLEKAKILAAFSLVNGPATVDEAMKDAEYLLENISIQIMKLLKFTY